MKHTSPHPLALMDVVHLNVRTAVMSHILFKPQDSFAAATWVTLLLLRMILDHRLFCVLKITPETLIKPQGDNSRTVEQQPKQVDNNKTTTQPTAAAAHRVLVVHLSHVRAQGATQCVDHKKF